LAIGSRRRFAAAQQLGGKRGSGSCAINAVDPSRPTRRRSAHREAAAPAPERSLDGVGARLRHLCVLVRGHSRHADRADDLAAGNDGDASFRDARTNVSTRSPAPPPATASSSALVGRRNSTAARALPWAIRIEDSWALSKRCRTMRLPPESTMAMVTPQAFFLASASAATIAFCAAADEMGGP